MIEKQYRNNVLYNLYTCIIIGMMSALHAVMRGRSHACTDLEHGVTVSIWNMDLKASKVCPVVVLEIKHLNTCMVVHEHVRNYTWVLKYCNIIHRLF